MPILLWLTLEGKFGTEIKGVEYPLLEGTTPPQVEFQAPKGRIGPIQGMPSLHSMEWSQVAVDRMIQAG